VHDHFAPAQFARLRPDQRLAAPPFESLTSGARVRPAATLGATARAGMDHDTDVQDPMAPPRKPRPTAMPAALVAVATAQRTPRRPPPGRYRLLPPRFVLASTRDLAINATGARIAGSQTAYAALREALRDATDGTGAPVRGLQIVPRAETSNPRARVVVVKEDENMRNTDFVDTVTGEGMTREEFVQKIRDGLYPDYAVREMHGIDTPVSKPTAAVDDNLG
jgi:hypothetical protein